MINVLYLFLSGSDGQVKYDIRPRELTSNLLAKCMNCFFLQHQNKTPIYAPLSYLIVVSISSANNRLLMLCVADMCREVEIFLACIPGACSRTTRVTWRQKYQLHDTIGRLSRRDGCRRSASCSCGDGRWRDAARGQAKALSDKPVSRSKSTPPGNGDSRSYLRISTEGLLGVREASNCHN